MRGKGGQLTHVLWVQKKGQVFEIYFFAGRRVGVEDDGQGTIRAMGWNGQQ
jgi:hypothetical protein